MPRNRSHDVAASAGPATTTESVHRWPAEPSRQRPPRASSGDRLMTSVKRSSGRGGDGDQAEAMTVLRELVFGAHARRATARTMWPPRSPGTAHGACPPSAIVGPRQLPRCASRGDWPTGSADRRVEHPGHADGPHHALTAMTLRLVIPRVRRSRRGRSSDRRSRCDRRSTGRRWPETTLELIDEAGHGTGRGVGHAVIDALDRFAAPHRVANGR